MGYRVTGCSEAKEALSLCFAASFDAVVVDLSVLENEEPPLARRLREHVAYKSLPIVGIARADAPPVPLGSGLDLVVEAENDVRGLILAIQRLRQQRGFLASRGTSPLNRHRS